MFDFTNTVKVVSSALSDTVFSVFTWIEEASDELIGIETVDCDELLDSFEIPPTSALNPDKEKNEFRKYINRGDFSLNDTKIACPAETSDPIEFAWDNYFKDLISKEFYTLLTQYLSFIKEEPYRVFLEYFDSLSRKILRNDPRFSDSKFNISIDKENPNNLTITLTKYFVYSDAFTPEMDSGNQIKVNINISIQYKNDNLLITEKSLSVLGDTDIFDELERIKTPISPIAPRSPCSP